MTRFAWTVLASFVLVAFVGACAHHPSRRSSGVDSTGDVGRQIAPDTTEPPLSVAQIEACEAEIDPRYDGRMHLDLEAARGASLTGAIPRGSIGWSTALERADHALVAFQRTYRNDFQVALAGNSMAVDAIFRSFAAYGDDESMRCDGWQRIVARRSPTCIVVLEAPDPLPLPHRNPTTGRIESPPPAPPAGPFQVGSYSPDRLRSSLDPSPASG